MGGASNDYERAVAAPMALTRTCPVPRALSKEGSSEPSCSNPGTYKDGSPEPRRSNPGSQLSLSS